MKYLILSYAILFVIINGAFSQKSFTPEAYIGFKSGGNISGVRFDPSISQDLNFGYVGGLVFQHIEQRNLGIQLELNFLQAGWNESLDSTNIYKRKLNYIQVPFMTHIKIGKDRFKFVINIGPYASFLLSERETINLIPEVDKKEYYGLIIENRVEYGLCAGVGFSQSTAIGTFQAEGRVNYSLSNLYNRAPETPFLVSHNQNAEVSLIYLLDFHNTVRVTSNIFRTIFVAYLKMQYMILTLPNGN